VAASQRELHPLPQQWPRYGTSKRSRRSRVSTLAAPPETSKRTPCGVSSPNLEMEKEKRSLAQAIALSEKVIELLRPACDKIQVAGSVRRQKPTVSDIEIVYIPKFKPVPDPLDLFGESRPVTVNCVDEVLEKMFADGQLEKRLNQNGSETWGSSNKYGILVRTGFPIDFFSTRKECWWSNLVCRTGGAESNKAVAVAANKMGWRWKSTGKGFVKLDNMGNEDESLGFEQIRNEKAVFDFVGMPCLSPERRN
jgi:DNA polymerase/3'-5' exonuclease PolX